LRFPSFIGRGGETSREPGREWSSRENHSRKKSTKEKEDYQEEGTHYLHPKEGTHILRRMIRYGGYI